MAIGYAHLTVKHPGGTDEYSLSEQIYRVGRGNDCEIRIDHLTVSRIHCCLVRVFEEQAEKNGVLQFVFKNYLLVHGPLTDRKKATNGVYVGGSGIPLVKDFNPEAMEAVEVGQAHPLKWGENIRLSPGVMLLYREPPTSIKPKEYRDDSTISEQG